MQFPLARVLPLAFALSAAITTGSIQAKVITVTTTSSFTTLDPWDADDTISQNIIKTVYEGLFGFDRNLKVRPALATSYDVSPDGKIYTVHLKLGVKFHDGEDFNAAAVKLNYDRVLNPKMGLSRYGLYKVIDRVEVIDNLTVRFYLKSPFSAFVNDLAHPAGAMICPKLLETAGGKKNYVAYHACGTGPYVLEKYNPAQYMTVKKNPNYHIAGLPKLDGITFRPTPEVVTAAAMLKTGESQYAHGIAPEQVPSFSSFPNIELETIHTITQGQIYINNQKKPFNDVRVRKALNYAINKVAMCKVVWKGYCQPATGVGPVGVKYAHQFGMWPYDPKKAKELLAEAGYPNGFEATLWAASNNTTYQKLLQFLQQQFAMVGVKVQVRALEAGQRVALMSSVKGPENSQMDMAVWGWSASTGEMDWLLRPLLATASWPPSLSNFSFYSNPVVDQAMADALATTDEKKKQEFYDLAQKTIWNDAPWVFLYVQDMISGHDKRLRNFYTMPNSGMEFTQAEWVE